MDHLPALILATSLLAPVLLTAGLVWSYRKWQDRDGRRSPIETRRIYGAGEQLRKRIDDQGDAITSALAMLIFLGPYLVAVWALQRVPWGAVRFGFWDAVLVAAFVVGITAAIAQVFRNGKQRRRCVAGLRAELFTAQELNRLMASGCTVLHDVPGERFNIDHVVIGPRAVYMVETKSVRKPRPTGSRDHFKVVYDGESLRFPDFTSRKPLAQARHQADWLATYLMHATGRAVPVVATLALPGWWIESPRSAGDADVRVFNPSGRGAIFMADDRLGRTLDDGVVGLVTQALVMRYPGEA